MSETNAGAQQVERPSQRMRFGVVDVFERAGLPVFLVLLIGFFFVHPDSAEPFRSAPNVSNLLGNQSVTALVALAMVIPLVAGYFDLSVAAIAGLANVTAASVMATYGQQVWVGLLAALVVGLAAGLVNAILVAGLKLNGFIATLGTYTLIGGLLQYYTKGTTILGVPSVFGNWGSMKWLGIPRPFWLLIAVALVIWYVLMHTPFGRQLEAIGSNESAARLVGISVDRYVACSFLGSAFVASIAGGLLTSRQGGADPTAGPAFLFPALAAVFLGATAIRPGRYNVWGTLFGIFLVAVAINGFTFLGAASWVSPVFNGTALVLAVGVSTLMGRRREAQARKALLAQAAEEAAAAPPPRATRV
ncbi:ABC transporter permease [Microbispora sp. H10836]|uniref:ABC transporter permease n=1 Tax=Microbispora sp. H10836 TaxID=2729106 RepID=UPI00147404B0|nr:ABC transporter permease [Microbispora sp. H10836]